jgi:hypothetical protein
MILTILLHNITEGSFGRGLTALWLIFSFIYFYKSKDNEACRASAILTPEDGIGSQP